MIYDTIENIGNYKGLTEYLDMAIEFIQETDLAALPAGKTPILENKVFVNVMEAGRFLICMAGEPHKPGVAAVADRRLKKCVVKVAVVQP